MMSPTCCSTFQLYPGVAIFAVLLTTLIIVSIITAEIFIMAENPEDKIVKDEIVKDSDEVAHKEDPTSGINTNDPKADQVPFNGYPEVQVERV